MDTPHTPGEYRGVAAYPPLHLNLGKLGIVNKKIFRLGNACMHNMDAHGRMIRHGYAIARFSHRPPPKRMAKAKKKGAPFSFSFFLYSFWQG